MKTELWFVLVVALGGSSIVRGQPAPIPAGIVSWWPGEDEYDVVGPNVGALQGDSSFLPGLVGSAFNFRGVINDGVDDSFVAPTDGLPMGNADRTLELWVKVDAFVANEAFFAGYGAFGSDTSTYSLGTLGRQLFFSRWGQSILGPELQTGTWYHVAASNRGSAAKLYLNGAVVGSADMSFNTAPGNSFYIGQPPWMDGRKLEGRVDEVSVYDRALCDSEVLAIYEAGNSGKREIALSVDCDMDGVPDSCELDCNGNQLPDACDIATGTSQDCDGDGIPDECEKDCNGNGLPDACDIASGEGKDDDGDGILDECEFPLPVPAGIVSWWSGDDESDKVGSNPGVLQGDTAFVPGLVGDAFAFQGIESDGLDDIFVATAKGLPTGNADRTLEFWTKVEVFAAEEAFFAGYGEFGTFDSTYAVGALGSQLFFSQWGASIMGPYIQTGEWHHVAVTNVGSAVRLYLNGAVVASDNMALDTPPGTSFYIGQRAGDDLRKLQGWVDEVSVYDRALCDAEILAIYKAGLRGKALDGGNQDCNRNGVPDLCDIASGTSADRDSDGIPDECGTGQAPRFHRGDADDSGSVDLTDAIRIVSFLFLGDAEVPCLDAGDVDDIGGLDLTDAIGILGFLFLGEAVPPDPGPPPAACGPDPGTEHLGCAAYTNC